MKYLSRKKVYQKIEASKNAKKLYIFCEGQETEIKYFKYFQGLSSNIDILPIPNVDGKSDPLKLKENAQLLFFGNEMTSPKFSLSHEYNDEIWFVIDTDRWNEGEKINQLKSFCELNNNSIKQWIVAQSNPSFELWFYYHFFSKPPEIMTIQKHVTFKDFVNAVIKGGFDNRSMPINIEKAIENSKANFEIESQQPKLFSTEVHSLAEVILPFVKDQIDKAREMMGIELAL